MVYQPFARTYGRMNPYAGFATTWEAYFVFGGNEVTTKMNHIAAFMDCIEAFG